MNVHPDWRVLGFTLLVSALVGLGSGLAPALASERIELVRALKETAGTSSGTSHRRWLTLGNGLVVVQMTISMLVLVGAGLLLRTVVNLKTVNTGFDPKNLLLFHVYSTYSQRTGLSLGRLGLDLRDQLATQPGVISASYSSFALMQGWNSTSLIDPIGSKSSAVDTNELRVAPDFFKTMQIPLVAGRGFNPPDLLNEKFGFAPHIAVVNESFARRFFGQQRPVGQRFRFHAAKYETEIIGVVGDAKFDQLRDDVQPTVYVPNVYTPIIDSVGEFEVRTAAAPKAMMSAIRSAITRFDPNLLIADMKTQEEQIDQNIYQERLIANLSTLFALLALIVACVGIYGLLSYQVTRRTQEIGIRLALGAQRGDVLSIVMRQGAALAVLGAVIGTGAALGVTRYLQSFLYGVKPYDPMTMIAVAFLLIAVALLASYIPARRAMRTDPMVALRYE
jgi:predicted permease